MSVCRLPSVPSASQAASRPAAAAAGLPAAARPAGQAAGPGQQQWVHTAAAGSHLGPAWRVRQAAGGSNGRRAVHLHTER